MFNVPLSIPSAYNAGSSKIYRLVTGPRGGKKWSHIETVHAAGVYLSDASFDAGEYKVTQWVNGFPRIIEHFEVTDAGKVNDLMVEY